MTRFQFKLLKETPLLYEFAMTPDLFDAKTHGDDLGKSELILVELLRGIGENGLIANFHKSRWSRHIDERLSNLPPSFKDKVIRCLTMLKDRHRLVRHPKCVAGDPKNDLDWLKLAMDSHRRIPFHGIFLSRNLLEKCDLTSDAFIEFLTALDSPRWAERRRRTLTLTKTPDDYQTALSSILRHAKSLLLIDPYLNSQETRFLKTISICARGMGQRVHARYQGRIYIHAEARNQKPMDQSLDECFHNWEKKLRVLIDAEGHRFKVFLWEKLSSYSEYMHDRFILTDQCGISAPGGLDCRPHSHANSTDWSLLDEESRWRRWQDYDPAASPFKLIEERAFF